MPARSLFTLSLCPFGQFRAVSSKRARREPWLPPTPFGRPPCWPGCLGLCRRGFAWRDDRQQNEILSAIAEMQRRLAAINFQLPIARIIVQKGPVACELVLHVRKPAPGSAGIHIVAAAYGQRDTMTLRHDDTGRNDFDIELVDLSGLQGLLFVVCMIGPERPREIPVQLAVRCAKPALPDWRVRIERTLEDNFFHVRRKYTQHDEKIRIICR